MGIQPRGLGTAVRFAGLFATVFIREVVLQCRGTSDLLSLTSYELDLGDCVSYDWPVITGFSCRVCCLDISADAGQLCFHLVDLQPQAG